MFNKKTKLKLTDFECNLLGGGMNEFRNMLLSDGIPTEDVDELLLKIINQSERQGVILCQTLLCNNKVPGYPTAIFDCSSGRVLIEDFYYGNIEPQECTTNLTTKVKKSLSELAGKEEHLTSILADKEQELFTDYVATYIKFSSLCNADSFTVGFSLGARFTYDTFIENKKG